MTRPRLERTALDGVLLIEAPRFDDHRGHFMELHHAAKYADLGVPARIAQVNTSRSSKGVLRGLHYQLRRPQGKLVTVVRGEIFDVAVDIRRGSPTFGRWFGATLSAANHRQMFVPGAFAHGFCVLSEEADVVYACTDLYEPGDDRGVLWNDPKIRISWPIADPILSDKDAAQPRLAEIAPEDLPDHRG